MKLSEKDLNFQIGLKIKRYRNQLKLSQKELGEKLNINDTTISAYELGKVSVSIYNLYQLANIFDIDIFDLSPTNRPSEHTHDQLTELLLDNLSEQLIHMDQSSKQQLFQIIELSLELYKVK